MVSSARRRSKKEADFQSIFTSVLSTQRDFDSAQQYSEREKVISDFVNPDKSLFSRESEFICGFIILLGPLAALLIGVHDRIVTTILIGAGFTILPAIVVAAISNYFILGRSSRAFTAYYFKIIAAAFITTIALGTFLPNAIDEMRHLEDLRQLDSASIDRIEIYQGSSRTKILTVTDRSAIARFAQSASDATTGWPVRNSTRTHTWYLGVSGSSRREYRLFFISEYPAGVVGEFTDDSGNLLASPAFFRSLAMREWIEVQLQHHLQ